MTTGLSGRDLAEIHQTLALFAHVFDNDDVEGLALVFTDDVTVEFGVGPGRSYQGIGAFGEYVQTKSPAAPDHHTLNTAILVDDDGTVRARSRYIGVAPDGGITSGEFLDVFRRTSAGWRISHRRSVPRSPRDAGAGVPPAEVGAEWLQVAN
jgi:ketosteroid isomerase-like protein